MGYGIDVSTLKRIINLYWYAFFETEGELAQ